MSDLADVWRLRQLRILEVTGPAGRDNPAARREGPESLHEELIPALLALAPEETSVELDTVHGSGAALEQLRHEPYEVLLVHHAPPGLDAPELLRALRSAEGTEAVIVLCSSAEAPLARVCLAWGADTLTVPSGACNALAQLVWRAAQRAEMARQLRRLDAQRRRRVQREADESAAHEHALEQIVAGLGKQEAALAPSDRHTPGEESRQPLREQYQQLLRLYVVMGSGNLSDEVAHWSLCLAGAGVGVAELFRLHLEGVARLKQALGNRGSRHCDRRADLLLIELLAHLSHHHERAARDHEAVQRSPNLADTYR